MVPAICLALLGLVLLPADRELVRGTHKQRQSSPTCPQGHCLFMCLRKKVEHIQWLRKGRVIEKEREGNKENERGEEYETERGKMLMRE